ncbi:DNA cytosine methyltransferase [Streptomyces albus]|uniref:DNA cytosine methyltransferase n=1 Tax=Streptomyces albus TaxID=1888 RepID=UPI00099E81C7|nr:DNA cytosine methyltransferase [Streptomyces albus]
MSASDRGALKPLTSVEVCAGAGGQAIGLHEAGFRHLALVEIDKHACATLRQNVQSDPEWAGCEVLEEDLKNFDPWRTMAALREKQGDEEKPARALEERELDLLAGGVPCPPFSVAGHRLGRDDERDLFPRMLEIVGQLKPRAVLIENVKGILHEKFEEYRSWIVDQLNDHGYRYCGWRLLESRYFDVPQLRPRAILIAIRKDVMDADAKFPWPERVSAGRDTLFDVLATSMEERRRVLEERFPSRRSEINKSYEAWKEAARESGMEVAPTLVGGSRKHGGADLGPNRAKKSWAAFGVNAMGVANEAQETIDLDRDFLRAEGPMLTVSQAAQIQSFPAEWKFAGGKTAQYRQVGNAFPSPVARALGKAIASVLQPERAHELLADLEIEYVAVDQDRPKFVQTVIGEESATAASVAGASSNVVPTDEAPTEAAPMSDVSAPASDCGEDLVGAGV